MSCKIYFYFDYLVCSFQGTKLSLCDSLKKLRFFCFGILLSIPNGDKGIRTLDPLLARQVLSQLSYTPIQVIFILITQNEWA